ncbi:MAG: DUF885 domain-containing protein [Lachnospiraceae bacterium]|nr:DUF885 domain-containing protein [Lachnospiraceae bacterium]
MNKLKQRITSLLLVLVMVFSIMVTGCDKKDNDSSDDKSQTTETPEEKNDNDDTDLLSRYNYEGLSFDEFTEELFKESITSDAVNVNYLLVDPEGYGIKEYPNNLGEYSKEYFTREIAHSKLILETLEKYDYNELNKEQQLTYDMIKASCGNDHMVEGMEYYFSCLGPSLGIQANLPLILCEYHWYNKSYIDKYLTILDTVDDYFQQICTFEKEKSEAGLFMSDDMADATIKQCETFIANTDNNLLITNFNEKIDKYEGLTDKEKSDYKAKNEKIVKETVLPAYQNIIDTLTSLKGTGTNPGGLSGFEKGKVYYEYLLRCNIGVDKTVEEIKKEVDSAISSNLIALNAMVLFNPDLASGDLSMEIGYTDPEEILKILKKAVLADFPDIGDVEYTITSFDESLEEFVSPAMYFLPPVDQPTVNSIYINNKYLEESGSIFTTLAHEGFPGHLYQYVFSARENHNPLRRQLAPNGLSEGWATYVEMHSYSYSDLDPNMAKLLATNNVLSLLIQARADIGVNYEGWTIEEMEEYLDDYFDLNEDVLKELYIQLIESPGNTLSYICGYLEYVNLEKMVSEALGDNYKKKDFTEFILITGFVPFSKMKQLLEEEFIPSHSSTQK